MNITNHGLKIYNYNYINLAKNIVVSACITTGKAELAKITNNFGPHYDLTRANSSNQKNCHLCDRSYIFCGIMILYPH